MVGMLCLSITLDHDGARCCARLFLQQNYRKFCKYVESMEHSTQISMFSVTLEFLTDLMQLTENIVHFTGAIASVIVRLSSCSNQAPKTANTITYKIFLTSHKLDHN